MRSIFMMMLILVAGLPWLACNRQHSAGRERTADEQDSKVAQEQNLPSGTPQATGQETNLPQGQSLPSTTPQETAQQVAEGELSKIDAQRQLLWIKTSDGNEIQFSYNKDTQVEGAGKTVEGLAKMSGNHLVIRYQAEGSANVASRGANMASRIEVQSRATQNQKQGSPSSAY